MLIILKWYSLVHMLATNKIVGHAVNKNRVSKLVFRYHDGNSIEVPAGCNDVEIHLA